MHNVTLTVVTDFEADFQLACLLSLHCLDVTFPLTFYADDDQKRNDFRDLFK